MRLAPGPKQKEHNSSMDGLAIVIRGNKATKNVATGDLVLVEGSTISGVSDGGYKALANVSAGTAFTSANLSVLTKGAVNALNDHIANKLSFNDVGSLTSSSSVSFTVQNSTYGILAIVGTATGRCGLYLFRTSSSSIYVTPIHDADVGGNITVATNGLTVTLTSNSASGSGVYAMFFSGGLAS